MTPTQPQWSRAALLALCALAVASCSELPSDDPAGRIDADTGTHRQALFTYPPYRVADLATEPGTPDSDPQKFVTIGSITYFVADTPATGVELWKTDGTAAGTALVADIYPGPNSSSPTALTAFNGILYFAANDGFHGDELWRTDGTSAGTYMVKDINPGSASSTIDEMILWNGKLWFDANDGQVGTELWTSDGTEAGTTLFADIWASGTSGSTPEYFTISGGVLYFAASNGTTAGTGYGRELYRVDAAGTGVERLSDIRAGTANSDPEDLFDYNGVLLFSALVGGSTDRELCISDGTPAGTGVLKEIRPGTSASSPQYFTLYDGEVYFSATDGTSTGQFGTELWKTDGTAAGTVLVADIRTGTSSSSPTNLVVYNGYLYFAATDGTSTGQFGKELWRTDGTAAGTQRVADILPGTGSSNPAFLTVYNNLLFFAATTGTTNGGTGVELYVSDGTGAGTYLLKDINTQPTTSGNDSSNPEQFMIVNGELWFVADDGVHGTELWKTDGTEAGTVMIADIEPYGDTDAQVVELAPFGDRLLFRADDGVTGGEPYITDGTIAGTFRLGDIYPGSASSVAKAFTAFGNLAVFAANDGTVGEELWVTDGTPAGTALVKDILASGTSSGFPGTFTPYDGYVLFEATSGSSGNGYELWRTDGTAAGTTMVKDINPGTSNSNPANLTVFNGLVFFSATNGTGGVGTELWVTDGTETGTVLFADIYPGSSSSSPSRFTVSGGKLFFTATTGTGSGGTGVELYVTDGAAPPTLVLDINTTPTTGGGTNSASPNFLTDFNGTLYFVANDGTSEALWKSDGTAAGTTLVANPYPGGDPQIEWLTVVGNTLFFSATDGVHGPELWKTDGTAAGTVMVKDIFPGPRGSYPDNFWTHGGKLYFAASDGVSGHELWESDGTAAGTVLVMDINPGLAPSAPSAAVKAGEFLYFTANDGAHGRELWAISLVNPPDLQPPVLTCPADLTVAAASPAGAAVTFPAPSVSDDVTPNPVVTVSHASGSTFPVGTTAVTVTATDDWGHTATCTFDVVVTYTDTSPPVITCPGDVVHASNDPTGDTVTLPAATVIDDFDPAPTVIFAPASGSFFPLGNTTVTATASDADGNTSSCTFLVTVNFVDTQAPVITCPPNQTTSTTDPNGAVLNYPAATATDNDTAPPVITYSHASGSQFPVGVTAVVATATDAANNSATCTFSVTVDYIDDVPPVVTCPPDVAVTTEDPSGTVVNYPPATATDNVAISAITYSTPSGATFPVGTTSVTATATDPSNNQATCSFDVVVTLTDVTPPVVTCPDDVTATTSGSPGNVVTYPPATATDNLTAHPTLTYSHPSGSVFDVGTTVVTVTATDDFDNTASCTFTVTLLDDTAPVITCPENVSAVTSVATDFTVTFPAATATDNVTATPVITYSHASGSVFPVGETTVTATATDEANNQASCTFTVLLADDVAPTLTCPADVSVETESDEGAEVTFDEATATDDVTESPEITWSHPSGSVFPVGTTEVIATATDTAGNTATCSVQVTVTKKEAESPGDGGGCGCSTSGNDGALALFGLLGVMRLANRRRART